jgi:hypothetical protein
LTDLESLIECDTDLRLNDPLLSSFPLFDTPPSSSHSNSIPSSPSSISTVSSSGKRRKVTSPQQHQYKQSFLSSDDDDEAHDDDFDVCHEKSRHKSKKNKYYSGSGSNSGAASASNCNGSSTLSLKDPMMMSASHSPSHFSSDLSSYMDQMFFSSSQYLSPSLAADDTIDLCTILKTENPLGYDNDMIMIG